MEQGTAGNVNGGKGGSKALLIIGVIVIVALLVTITAMVVLGGNRESNGNNDNQAQTEASDGKRSVVTPDNVQDIVEEMAATEPTPQGYYTVSMTSEWHFADGTAVSEDAYVENIEENTNDIYFDVVLADDEEHVIYESPVIARGASFDQIQLKEDLDPGTYDCVMIYHLVDEDQNPVDSLRVTVTVIVEE